MEGSVQERTKFIYELSREVQRCQSDIDKQNAARERMDRWVTDTLKPQLAELRGDLDASKKQCVSGTKNLEDENRSMGTWIIDHLGSNMEKLAEFLRHEMAKQEQRLNMQAKEREQSLWEIFSKKMEEERRVHKAHLQELEKGVRKIIGEGQDSWRGQYDSLMTEQASGLRKLSEGLKIVQTMESSSERCQAISEKCEKAVRRIDAECQKTEELRKRVQGEFNSRKSAENEQKQYNGMIKKLEQYWVKCGENAKQMDHERSLLSDHVQQQQKQVKNYTEVMEQEVRRLSELRETFESQRESFMKRMKEEGTRLEGEVHQLQRERRRRDRWAGESTSVSGTQVSTTLSTPVSEIEHSNEDAVVEDELCQWLQRRAPSCLTYAPALRREGFDRESALSQLEESDLDRMLLPILAYLKNM